MSKLDQYMIDSSADAGVCVIHWWRFVCYLLD